MRTSQPIKTLLGTEIEIVEDKARNGVHVIPGDIEVVDLRTVSVWLRANGSDTQSDGAGITSGIISLGRKGA